MRKLFSQTKRYSYTLLVVIMFFTIATTNVFATNVTDSGGVTTMDFGNVPLYNIQLDTENVLIKSEGSTFKIQMSTASKNSYSIEDYAETTDKYGNVKSRQIVVRRKEGVSVFSPTITIIVPTSAKDQNSFVSTTSGNIHMENTHNKICTLQSQSGDVYISNSYAKMLQTTSTSGNIDVINNTTENYINAQSDTGTVNVQCPNTNNVYTVKIFTEPNANISINGQRYDGGNYVIGPNEPLRYILLGGKSNTLKLTNVVLRETKKVGVSSPTTTDVKNISGNDFFLITKQRVTQSVDVVAQQFQQFNDIDNTISSMDFDVLGVDLIFELSSNNSFSAELTYPSELNSLYKDVSLQMKCIGQTLNLKTVYPNGENNQDQDIESIKYATLIVQVPQRQYKKVKLNITATNSQTKFTFPSSEIEINKIAGDVSFELLNHCNSLRINNQAGDFSIRMNPLAKSTVIDNKVGEFNVYLANDPTDFDLQITNISTSGWELPNQWDYSELEGEWVKYRSGAGSNKMSFTNEIGNINFFVGQ